jgi:hypothetical protein
MKGSRISHALKLLVVLLGFSSCSSSLNSKQYTAWVENPENKLHLIRKIGDYKFDLQYKPAEYVFLQQIKDQPVAGIDYLKAIEDIGSMQYYTLIIGLDDISEDLINYNIHSEAEKQERLYYLSYLFQNDIYIEGDSSKLPCILFHFERSYDLKPTRTFVLAFENPNKAESITQLVIDSPIFNTGPVKFKIDKKGIPNLNI